MPKVTIHIREMDYDKWKAITDRPAWIHLALQLNIFYLKDIPDTEDKEGISGSVVGELDKEDKPVGIYRKPIKHCQHAAVIGNCKFGCKK